MVLKVITQNAEDMDFEITTLTAQNSLEEQPQNKAHNPSMLVAMPSQEDQDMHQAIRNSLTDSHPLKIEKEQQTALRLAQTATTKYQCTILNVDPFGDCLIACDLLDNQGKQASTDPNKLWLRRQEIITEVQNTQDALLAKSNPLLASFRTEQLKSHCLRMRTAQVVLGDPEISALASLRHSEIYVITAHCLAGSSLEGELLSPVVFKPKGDLRTRPLFLFHENKSNPHFQ